MGDNRTFSKDSRFFGTIEKDDIVGRVFVRIWPLNRLDLL
jgi:signal peptidase I